VIGREDALETTASLGFLILSSLARRVREDASAAAPRRRFCFDVARAAPPPRRPF
jgi:hypothetical protein